MQDSPADDLDAIAERVLASSDDETSPDVAAFLARRYVSAPRSDVGDSLGTMLARGLDAAAESTDTAACAAWLSLFCDVAAIADDERVRAAAQALVDRLHAAWPAPLTSLAAFADGAAAIDACLRASAPFDRSSIAPAAIDELERLIGWAYRPGQPLGAQAFETSDAAPIAHVSAAAALLSAFEISGRLPYPMLAEELIQPLRRPPLSLDVGTGAARVLCRLAALHDDPDYRRAAVVAADANYRDDAARILRSLSIAAAGPARDAARYAVALYDCRASTHAEEPRRHLR